MKLKINEVECNERKVCPLCGSDSWEKQISNTMIRKEQAIVQLSNSDVALCENVMCKNCGFVGYADIRIEK